MDLVDRSDSRLPKKCECGRQFVAGACDEDTTGQLLAEASEVLYRDVMGTCRTRRSGRRGT